MIRSSVDLPLPLGPSSAISAPSPTVTETSSSAANVAEVLADVARFDRHQTAVSARVRRVSRFINTSVANASSASTTAAVYAPVASKFSKRACTYSGSVCVSPSMRPETMLTAPNSPSARAVVSTTP